MQLAAFRYLLDTNVVSDLVHELQGAVARRIVRVGERWICTIIAVACELRFGAAKRRSAALAEQVESVPSALPVLHLEPDTDRHYAEIRVRLEKAGRPIGANDVLIAAQARAAGLVVVTRKIEEFRRVPGLKVVAWPTGVAESKPLRTKP